MIDPASYSGSEYSPALEFTHLAQGLRYLPDGIVIFDTDLRYIYVNEAAARLTDHTPEQLIGKPYNTLFPDYAGTPAGRAYLEVLQTLIPTTIDVYVPHLGKHYAHQITPTPIGITVTIRDVSDQRATATHLQESESNLEAIIENSLDSIWSVNRRYEIQYVNKIFVREYEAVFGIHLTRGINILEGLPESLRHIWAARYNQVLQGQSFIIEDVIPFGDDQLYIEVAGIPIVVAGVVTGASMYGRNITAQKQAERALRAERDLLSAGPVFSIVWDPSPGWPVVYVSKNVTQALGYTQEELMAPAFRYVELIHPDDRARVATEAKTFAQQQVEAFEQSYRLRHKDGVYRWFYDFTRMNREGEKNTVRGYLFDQTNLKELETALSDQRERLDNIITGTHAGTWEWEVQTGRLTLNERWAEIIGYTLAELAPVSIETWTRLAHPDDLLRSNQLLSKHFRGELDYFEIEGRMLHKEGHWVWVLERGKVSVRDETGRPVRMSGTQQDITERKRAALALQESEDRYRSILEVAPIGIGVYQDGKIAFANPAGIRLLGAQQDTDLIGRSLDQLLHPDAIAFLHNTGPQLLHGHVERLSFEGQVIRLDGSLMEAEITISRLHYHHKPALQVIVSDISERSHHLKAIEAQNRILKDIAWDQSHLVRAPLARMMGLLGLMQDDNFEDFPQADMIRFIMDSAHELDQIIRNISDKAYAVSLIQDEYQHYQPTDFRHHVISNVEVLLIDDDPVIQKLQRTVLVRNGLHDTPRSFLTALEGLEFILSHDKPGTVFLLLLDINMPQMNGWELLEALRQHKLSSHVMVIMLTSSIDISDRIRASAYPEVIEYLTKPITRHTVQELKNHPILRYLWQNHHTKDSPPG